MNGIVKNLQLSSFLRCDFLPQVWLLGKSNVWLPRNLGTAAKDLSFLFFFFIFFHFSSHLTTKEIFHSAENLKIMHHIHDCICSYMGFETIVNYIRDGPDYRLNNWVVNWTSFHIWPFLRVLVLFICWCAF